MTKRLTSRAAALSQLEFESISSPLCCATSSATRSTTYPGQGQELVEALPSILRSEVDMDPTIPLMVAISDNPGIKHWSLFLDAEDESDKTVINIVGARQRYFRDVRTSSDARISSSLIELCTLCGIETTNINAVKDIAWDTPVRNEESDYSCQDFVLDVLNQLEDANIIDAECSDYQRKKVNLKAKRESWP